MIGSTALGSLAIAVMTACSGAAPPRPVSMVHGVSLDAIYPVASIEVEFAAGGRRVPGTITMPTARGQWPAIVLIAGSGPTDRDWGQPLGSGKLLAAELASRGAVVLRYDKAHAGKNPGPPLAELTLDTYRDEALGAIAFVRARPDVRADRVFVAGHSEGGAHATRAALVVRPPLAGVVYLAATSRTMAETMLSQLAANLVTPAAVQTGLDARAELASLRDALADFLAGKPVDPARATTIPQLQRVVASIFQPATAPLMRSLLAFENAAEAPKLTVPVLVINGGKDVQVDPDLDARRLANALREAGRDVTLAIAPDADHVLKHEPRPLTELRADLRAVSASYNADDRALDKDVVAAIVAWLASRT